MGGEVVRAGCIVWGAGVKAAPVATWLGVPADRAGRVSVGPDLAVAGLDRHLRDRRRGRWHWTADGQPLPALAQVAHQQGSISARRSAGTFSTARRCPPFRFRNRGNTAIIGRDAAVFDFGRWHLKGRIGWLFWAIVHIYLLTGFDKRRAGRDPVAVALPHLSDRRAADHRPRRPATARPR